jgi:hypothetical protein
MKITGLTLKQHDIMTVIMSENVKGLTRLHKQKRLESIFGSTATPEELGIVLEIYEHAKSMKRMFIEVNRDCAFRKESVVDFSDTEYYTEQIGNIYDMEEGASHMYAELFKEIEAEGDELS